MHQTKRLREAGHGDARDGPDDQRVTARKPTEYKAGSE